MRSSIIKRGILQIKFTTKKTNMTKLALDACSCVGCVTGDSGVVFVQRRSGYIWIVTRNAG